MACWTALPICAIKIIIAATPVTSTLLRVFRVGKTLSLVHKVTGQLNVTTVRPSGARAGASSSQRVLILSMWRWLCPIKSCAAWRGSWPPAKVNQAYDDEHDTLTVTIACVDELGVQLNSRSFGTTSTRRFLSAAVLPPLLHKPQRVPNDSATWTKADARCHAERHQCRKIWRLQCNSWYDAWELENVTNPELVRPLRRGCWFVLNKDYRAYNTLAVVDTLTKRFEEKDMLGRPRSWPPAPLPPPAGCRDE